MKKLINGPGQVVDEMIEGLLASLPGLARLAGYNVLLRSDAVEVRDRQVAVLSGGGSGHEPAHAGYVGAGMLSAAVAGEVFTSPSAESVSAALKTVAGKPGALLIVKNYTGDRLNFGVAAEMARADGIAVETVLVADDVALTATQGRASARGIAGTVFVHKIAGAAAQEGKPLSEVAHVAQSAAGAVATMGVSLSAGTVPAIGRPSFTLNETEMELGLGIHGEPGVQRMGLLPADELTDKLLEAILSASPADAGEPVAVMINNLGSTTMMELAIVARQALANLRSRNVVVQRVYLGTFMSSLDMAGVSLSVLRLNDERLRLLDAPTTAPAWPNVMKAIPSPPANRTIASPPQPALSLQHPVRAPEGNATRRAIEAACQSVQSAQDHLTELDRAVGDGDLGITLTRGAAALLEALPCLPLDSAEALTALGQILQGVLGGSSGPLYGVLFLRAGSVLKSGGDSDAAAWAKAIREASAAVSQLGGASAGDRTMLDALLPFAEQFESAIGDGATVQDALSAGVSAAENGAKATSSMMPRRGRSSYLGERALGHPDPGAVAVALIIRAVVSSLY